jgi:hypothetical protein
MSAEAGKAFGLIGGGLQAVGGLAQLASGIFGRKGRQRRLENLIASRPKYQIPKEIQQDMEMRRNRVNSQLDEQQALRDNLFTQQQNQIAMAQQSGGSIEDMLAVGASQDASMSNALINAQAQGASQRAQRLDDFSQAGMNLAQAKDQAFKINELDPANMRIKGTLANDAMSREMTFGGLNQAGGGLANIGSTLIATA